jgi:hypothetical protein
MQAFACLVVPYDASVADETDLTQFVVHWTALEAVTGLEMFPALTSAVHQSNNKQTNTKGQAADWKASADAVTRAVTQNQITQLLLTDGKSAGGGNRNQKHSTPLQHLCSQGQCQRPYILLLSSSGTD